VIRFSVGRLFADHQKLDSHEDRVLNVAGEFGIVVDGRPLFSEVSFPVVELARELVRWLKDSNKPSKNFEYDSMFFEEKGAVWLRSVPDGWRIGSIYQERPETRAFTLQEIQESVTHFVRELIVAGRRDLNIDLTQTIDAVAGNGGATT